MRKGITLFTILALALASTAFADRTKAPIRNIKPIGAEYVTPTDEVDHMPLRPIVGGSLDSAGTPYQAGTTWYDYQHNGTTSKMISHDENGWIHVVWMNGLNEGASNRHVYYNTWDPSTEAFILPDGLQVDAGNRGGYTCQVTSPDGRCYPVFHQITSGTDAFAAASIDFIPQAGAFTTVDIPHLEDARCGSLEEMEVIWPHAARDTDGNLHVVSMENPCTEEAGDPQRFYYSRGYPEIDGSGFGISIDWEELDNGSGFQLVDTVMVIAADIACSRSESSNRVVIAWADSRDDLANEPDSATQRNNDIYYMASEDGGVNWGDPINVTLFDAPDFDCVSGDTAECNKDTFRVYTDCSLILDANDNAHIAFTTTMYWSLEGTISRYASQIWHWGEGSVNESNDFEGEISPIFAVDTDYLTLNWADDIGDWQYILQRPNLCADDVTGDLYCAYQFRDTLQWSEIGIPQADAFVAKSVDCGRSWSMGVNVTETDGGQNTPAGQNQHERDITLSETVSYVDGNPYLHMEYIFDLDAGGAVGDNPTGVPTENPVIYRRIPANEIPAEPRFDHLWAQIHVDGDQLPYGGNPDPVWGCVDVAADDNPISVPDRFYLHQNYPNPFNPTTRIQFDLSNSANVSLQVFNVLGQEVATLLNDKPLTAGVQFVDFDATNLPSGVYVYQMNVAGNVQSRKMVLLK